MAVSVGDAAEIEVEEGLANAVQWALLRGARAVGAAGIFLVGCGAGQKAEQWIKALAEAVCAGSAIHEIVGVVSAEAPCLAVADRDVSLSRGGPTTELEATIFQEGGGVPDGVGSGHGVGEESLWVAIGDDGSDAEMLIDVVGDTAGEQVSSVDFGRGQRQGLLNDGGHIGGAGLGVQQGDAPGTDVAVDLDAALEGDVVAIEQADIAAEKWDEG